MAFTFEALVGSLKMDISDWSTKLPVAQRQLSDFTKKAAAEAAALQNKTSGMLSSLTSGVTNAIPGLGSLNGAFSQLAGGASMAAGAVAGLAITIGVKAVQAAAEAEQVAVRLDSVLKATGNTTGMTRDEMETLAEQIQKTTQYEDEAALSAMTMLASMKEIRGDVFRDVVTTAADMSVVLGSDLTSAAEMLGRALVDPEQAAARLMRAGIHLSDVQKGQIKTFVEMNDVASAQRVILDELASRYGGAAAAQADTMAGSLAQLSNEVDNLLEALGDAGLIYVIKGLSQAIKVSGFSVLAHTFKWIGEAIDSPLRKLLQIRIAWNEFWGDVKEAAALKAELEFLKDDKDRSKIIPSGGAAPKPQQHLGGRNSGGASAYGSGGSRGGRSFSAGDDGASGLGAAGTTAFHAQFLAQATPKQAAEFVKSLQREIDKRVKDGGLLADPTTNTVDVSAFEEALTRYESHLKLMPGFNAEVWGKVRETAIQNLKMAAASNGEMRELYLKTVQDAMGTAETMFTDIEKKADEAKRKAEELERTTAKAKADANKDAAYAAENQRDHQKEMDATLDKRRDKSDPLAWMQSAKKGDITKRMAAMSQQWGNSKQLLAMMGIGTPEQRRGLKEFESQMMGAMKAVRDSTGETRAANIEQLRQLEAAWAKAFEAIRNGSTETMEQLVADAMKEGKAGQNAADRMAKGALGRGGGQSGGVNPIGQVFAMSEALSNLYTNALSGFGGGVAAFQQLLADTTDPLERAALLTENINAQMAGANLNAHNFGVGMNAVAVSQASIVKMERERSEALRQQNLERETAAKLHEENFRKGQATREAQERDKRREQGLDFAGAVAVGKVPPIVLNINGVNDVRQAYDNLEKEMARRGHARSGKRTFGTPERGN